MKEQVLRPKKGQRFRSRKDLQIGGVVTFSAPYTGSFEGVLPKGEVLIVEFDPPPNATGVYLQPVNYAPLEMRLISTEDRSHPKYDSYAISLTFESLAKDFELLRSSTNH